MTSNLLFGSIGVLVETSEIQRQSFNRALKMNGITWNWNIGTYCNLLKSPGGKKRVIEYSKNQISVELAERIHRDKQSAFEELIGDGLEPRVGCLEALKKCKDNGGKVDSQCHPYFGGSINSVDAQYGLNCGLELSSFK